MITIAVIAILITALAALAGLRILKKEYLPLLMELTRTKQKKEEADPMEDREEDSI